jgi:hypothetical protein
MLHDRLALFVIAGSMMMASAGAGTGCMKPAAPRPAAAIVIPVDTVRGPPLAIGGSAESPHFANESDGHVAGEHVLVESHGTWLPATLVERHGGRWLVHYSASWGGALDALEELVESTRIRPAVEPMDQEHSPDDGDP